MRCATLAWASLLAAVMIVASATGAEKKIKVLIIGGQNNHDWAKSTPFMKDVLDKAGHFETTVCNAPLGQGAGRRVERVAAQVPGLRLRGLGL